MFEQVKSFYGNIGNISKHVTDNTLRYTVSGVANCKIIQNHFLNYPLLTYKLVYFQLWSSALDIMAKNEHLTSQHHRTCFAVPDAGTPECFLT